MTHKPFNLFHALVGIALIVIACTVIAGLVYLGMGLWSWSMAI